jgi:hypothetical protein
MGPLLFDRVDAVGGGFVHEDGPDNPNVDWYTPRWVFERLGLHFDLDPCSAGVDRCFVPAKHHFVLPEHDGLRERWFGCVWLNPPYGRQTGVWLDRLAAHADGIALVFARTGTRWFQRIAEQADAVSFCAGRIAFVRSDGATGKAPGADSMFLAWGPKCVEALSGARFGWMVHNR